MIWQSKKSVGDSAREHADLGVNLVEDEIIRRLGPRPVGDAVGNHEFGSHAAALGRGSEIGEIDDDLRRLEGERTRHTHPLWILLGLIFCVVVEAVGCVLVLRSLGMDEGERVLLGVALSLSLIGITAMASKSAATPASAPASGAVQS